MKFRLAVAAAMTICGAATAAEPSLIKADPVKGQAVAQQVCAACHGPDGNSIAPANPKLAAQVPEYLYKQLANFKAAPGKQPERPSAIMAAFANPLSAEDMHNLAAYYANQKLVPDKANKDANLELGRKIYRAGIVDKGVAACAGCHGATGAGVPVQYPRLAGQYADYIEAQMKVWRSEQRANDPNKMMRDIAGRLSDTEIKAVSNYIAGLR
jgi:cytochrome c553